MFDVLLDSRSSLTNTRKIQTDLLYLMLKKFNICLENYYDTKVALSLIWIKVVFRIISLNVIKHKSFAKKKL